MNVSPVVGGGFGAVVGAAIAGALSRWAHVDVTAGAAYVIGSFAVTAGAAIGHGIDKYGLAGLLRVLIHGVPKGTT